MRFREIALLFSARLRLEHQDLLLRDRHCPKALLQSGALLLIELALRLSSPFGPEDACSTWYPPAVNTLSAFRGHLEQKATIVRDWQLLTELMALE